jgi:hypothetical protein
VNTEDPVAIDVRTHAEVSTGGHAGSTEGTAGT